MAFFITDYIRRVRCCSLTILENLFRLVRAGFCVFVEQISVVSNHVVANVFRRCRLVVVVYSAATGRIITALRISTTAYCKHIA